MKRRTVPFTKTGYEEKVKEHSDLNKKRVAVVSELSRARDLGDRSENGAYKAARSALSRLDSRIRFLKRAIDNAQIIPSPQNGSAGIGSVVVLKAIDILISYTIVGDYESDIPNKKLSHRSPLGHALIGKRKGERVSIDVPAGRLEYTIEDVR